MLWWRSHFYLCKKKNMKSDTSLRTYIRQLLEFRTSSDLLSIEVRLRVRTADKDHPGYPIVPDIMTNIRVLPGVSIVRQTVPIKRIPGGRNVLALEIKYMPMSADLKETLVTFGKELRSIAGIEIVKIVGVGGRKIEQQDGSSLIF